MNENVPLWIRALAVFIIVPKWENDVNLAKGEIEKFNFHESCKNKFSFGKQAVSFRDGFDLIWVHIADDWFKLIGKDYERTC